MEKDKRILFLTPGGYGNLLRPISYVYGRNIGDLVYFMAGMSFFYDKSIHCRYLPWTEVVEKLQNDDEYVRKNYDLCIYMEANIFNLEYIDSMRVKVNELFNKLKVPLYILGAGVQSTKEYSLEYLSCIEDITKYYVEAVLNTGGAITLRGDFTRLFLEKIGFSGLFVSGCPSLYYDKNMHISNHKCRKEDFNVILNGRYISDIDEKIYTENQLVTFFVKIFIIKHYMILLK